MHVTCPPLALLAALALAFLWVKRSSPEDAFTDLGEVKVVALKLVGEVATFVVFIGRGSTIKTRIAAASAHDPVGPSITNSLSAVTGSH